MPRYIPRNGRSIFNGSRPAFRVSDPAVAWSTTSRRIARVRGARNTNDDQDVITNVVESISSIFSTPLGFLDPPLATGYPILLLAGLWILPPATSLLLILLFTIYSWLGRSVILEEEVEEDEQRPPTDLLALGAATVTSGLLAPFSSSIVGGKTQYENVVSDPFRLLVIITAVSVVALYLSFVANKSLSKSGMNRDEETLQSSDLLTNEKQLMEIWDQSLNERNKKGDNSNDKTMK